MELIGGLPEGSAPIIIAGRPQQGKSGYRQSRRNQKSASPTSFALELGR